MASSVLLRNVAAVVSGTAAGQVIIFAFSPLITRIYGPDVFGLQGVFLSLVSILTPVIALRYPMAIVVAKDEVVADRLAALSFLIAVGLSCLLAVLLAVGQKEVLFLLGVEALGGLIWFLPLALFCVALQDIASFRAARFNAFRLVGIVTAVHAFLTNLARVLGGLVAPTAGVLVGLATVTPAVQAAMLHHRYRRQTTGSMSLSVSEALSLARQYWDFPFYRTPTDVFSAVSQTCPVILLSILSSPSAAGLYTVARSVVNLPLNVIGNAVGNVYYVRLAQTARDGAPLFPFVLKATLWQFLIPGGATLLAALTFPSLFAVIFGESWRPAGEFAQWMSLWVVCMLANIPSVRALPVIGRQDVHLLFNVLLTAGGIVGLLAGHALWQTALGSVAIYSIVTVAIYVAQIVTYLAQVHRYDRKSNSHG